MTDMLDLDPRRPAELDPAAARHAWRMAEPLHAMIYFAPEAQERYAALGLVEPAGYFATRAAPLGAVGPQPVSAAFFNFNPALVSRVLPDVWQRFSPAAALQTRLAAADAALTRALGDAVHGTEVAEAAALARRAAEAAGAHPEGRPLFAAHAALPWPDAPHLVLWHAQTLLREFRGDGHVAALTVAGLSGLQALVLHVATGEGHKTFQRRSRGWSPEQWADAVRQLQSDGLLDAGEEPALTDTGRAQRAAVEAATDRLAIPAYAPLGADGCARLAELARPLSRAVVAAGLLDPATIMPPRR